MLVLKFGGTSVGSIQNIKKIQEIIDDGQPKVVVLSAMSGSTNTLVSIAEAIQNQEKEKASQLILKLKDHYTSTAFQLLEENETYQLVADHINTMTAQLLGYSYSPYQESFTDKILAQGELFSTLLVHHYFKSQGLSSALISALDFMRVDKENEPDQFYIQQNLARLLKGYPNNQIFVTQGFICLDAFGNISNLRRGGSDYSATIIGAALKAKEVQIWTDIDGFHNNDPRVVEDTTSIAQLSFDEAAELAYFGAKILHPQTVIPVKEVNIPVRLKNTMQPTALGTLISTERKGEGIKAIAAKDDITVIKIKSERMLLAHGFLKKVFEIFEKYETSIDMITTSEIAVSLTIDQPTYIKEITNELEKFSTVEVEANKSIVCLVGNNIVHHQDTPKLFQILQDVTVRMIAYGGSNNNISLLINTPDKATTLQLLNQYVFTTARLVH